MGSIQNRRGSVRQAPPDIYAPFLASEDDDVGQDCVDIATDSLFLLWIGIVIYGAVAIWRGIRSLF